MERYENSSHIFRNAGPFCTWLNEQESFALKFDEGMLCHCVPYEGSYDIRPGLLAQTLPTNDRHLHEDILVRAIPYTEVSNIQHGLTAIIGGN